MGRLVGRHESSGSPDRVQILHVDDNPEFLDLTAEFLQREDEAFEILTETSARSALDRLEASDIECVISDYEMPGMDGLEFLQAVRETRPDLPFILFTGKGSEQVAGDAISAGATDYLQKRGGAEQYEMLANRVQNAVKRLRADRQRERHIEAIETAQEGISILDEDGYFEFVNESYGQLYGYEPEELVGESWRKLYPEGDLEYVYEEVIPVLEETGYWHGETTGLRADGSTFIEDHTLAKTDRGDIICTIRDASEERRQERELKRRNRWLSERQYRTERTQEVTAALIETTDRERIAELVTDAAEDIFSLKLSGVHLLDEERDLLEGVAATDTVREEFGEVPDYPQNGRNAAEAIWEIFENGEPVIVDDTDTQEPYATVDSPVRSLLVYPLDDHGVYILSSTEPDAFDETDISLAELLASTATAALTQANSQRELEQYQMAMETVPDPVLLLDADGTIKRVNEAWGSIVGFDPEELHGEPFTVLTEAGVVNEGVIEQYLDLVRTLLSSDTDQQKGSFMAEAIPPDDTDPHTYEVHIGLLPYEDEFQGVAGVVRDVTERVEYQRALERKNERLDQFASTISHDIKNPINVLSQSLILAKETGEAEHFERCERAINRMEHLTDRLLALARAGEELGETQPVSLDRTVDGCWQTVATADADIITQIDSTVEADPDRLKQLLENLFRNAVEHGGDDVTVTVGELPDGFYVADDGPGIPEDEREAVLEHGYSTAADGTGLGLAIVAQIVKAHGWEVTIDESESGGARIEITGIESTT